MKRIYLAIPYRNMKESSFKQATYAAALIYSKLRENVFSPISHSHLMVEHGLPDDWDFWREIDEDYLREFATELWILIPEEGWDKVANSQGVNAEIALAKRFDLPIHYIQIKNKEVVFVDEKVMTGERISTEI